MTTQHPYFVSRQHASIGTWWLDTVPGSYAVEIVDDPEYAGAFMLRTQYGELGECQEYSDPREAVRAAIAVRDAWHRDMREVLREIPIVCGNTDNPLPSESELLEWADRAYSGLVRCAECDKILLGSSRDWVEMLAPPHGHWTMNDGLEESDKSYYCSGYCCERAYETEYEYWAEQETETRIYDLRDQHYASILIQDTRTRTSYDRTDVDPAEPETRYRVGPVGTDTLVLDVADLLSDEASIGEANAQKVIDAAREAFPLTEAPVTIGG